MPPVTIHWYDGGILPARPAELDADAINGVYSKDLPDWDTENGVISSAIKVSCFPGGKEQDT